MNTFPDRRVEIDRHWSLVAAGALLGCVGIGVMFSLAVLLQSISTDTGWSRAGLSSAMTLGFLAMGVAGFGWGAASDRIGPRWVTLAGAFLLGLGCLMAARSTTLAGFQLCYGVVIGIATASFFAPVMAITAALFDRRRNLAISLVSAGVGVAPMTISPLVAWLLAEHGWRDTLTWVGFLAWALTLPAVLFIPLAPASSLVSDPSTSDASGQRPGTADDERSSTAAALPGPPPATIGQALRSRPFIVLSLAFFACCAAQAGAGGDRLKAAARFEPQPMPFFDRMLRLVFESLRVDQPRPLVGPTVPCPVLRQCAWSPSQYRSSPCT